MDDEVGDGPSGPPPLRFDVKTGDLSGIAGLPTRHSLVVASDEGRKLHAQTEAALNKNAPVLFLPNDVKEEIRYDGPYGKAIERYQLHIFGNLPDGSKAHVIVNDAPVQFGIWIPPESAVSAEAIAQWSYTVSGLLAEFNLERTETGKAFPLRGYHKEPRDYLRCFFANVKERRKAILAVRNHGFETFSDDKSSYFRLLTREHQISLCSWMYVSAYQYEHGGGAAPRSRQLRPAPESHKSTLAAHVLTASISSLKTLVSPLDPDPAIEKKVSANAALSRDRSLVLTYDCETHSPNKGTGAPPQPAFNEDVIFMICMTAHWRGESEPLARICLTTQETAPDSRWTTMICGQGGGPTNGNRTSGQDSLLLAFAHVWHQLAPDVVVGFNNFQYDAPWLAERGRQLGLLVEMDQLMNAIPRKKTTEAKVLQYQYHSEERVKLTADSSTLASYLRFPGCVPLDSRQVYQKLYPKMEKTSLKAFLSMVGLGGKADMPYQQMFRYYEEAVQLADEGTGSTPLSAEHMRHVAHYCVIDALRCQELLLKRNVVQDYREVGNYSFTCLYDCVFYAGGHKVRNMLFAYCVASVSLLGYPMYGSMISDNEESEGKYTGAHVAAPIKGLDEDNPITGLDFKSLYPSLIRAYNLSLDRMVFSEEEAQALEAEGKEIWRVEFPYGGRTIRGWFVRHQDDDRERGVFARALADLFDKRNGMKAELAPLEAEIEHIKTLLGAFRKTTPDGFDEFREFYFKHLEAAQAKEAAVADATKKKKKKGRSLSEEMLDFLVANNMTQDAAGVSSEKLFKALSVHLDDLEFRYVRLYSKQAAVKVFMNTFYGEAGSKTSPIFELALAGGVTSAGQYNWFLVHDFVVARGFGVKYGDTDSLYLTCPPEAYAGAEAKYQEALGALGIITPCSPEQEEWDRAFAAGQARLQAGRDFVARMEDGQPESVLAEAKRRLVSLEGKVRDERKELGPRPAGSNTWLTKIIADKPELRAPVDKAYERFCAEKVRITMKIMAKARDDVNDELARQSKTRILKVVYEETLLPTLLTGKKKYCGIAHVSEPNFNILNPEKDIFIRGIDVIKQGQTRLAKVIGYKCMMAATTLHPPGDRVPFMDQVENILRDLLTGLSTFRAGDASRGEADISGGWELKDFIQSDAWKPDKDNKSVQKFMRRMRPRHRIQLHENKARIEHGEEPRKLDYLEPEPGARFEYLVVDAGPTFSLQGFADSKPTKGAMMEYVHVAIDRNLRINVPYYITSCVVGLCARFINYADQFELKDPNATAKEQDKFAQERAKAYLVKFVRGLSSDQRGLSQRRGVAYKRAYKSAARRACQVLRDDLGECSALLTGSADLQLSKADHNLGAVGRDGIDYELFLPPEDEDSVPVPLAERMRGAAAKIAEAICDRFNEPLVCWDLEANEGLGAPAGGRAMSAVDRTIETLGVDSSPEGRDELWYQLSLVEPPSRRTRARRGNLFEPPVISRERFYQRIENEAYTHLEDNETILVDVAERLHSTLDEMVSNERALEHLQQPDILGVDIGEPDATEDVLAESVETAAETLRCSAGERETLRGMHAAWQKLVNVSFQRQFARRVADRLRVLRDRTL